MSAMRRFASPVRLIPVAIGVGLLAVAVLVAFPGNAAAWQVAAWTLVAALAALLVLVVVAGCILAIDRAARTWPMIAAFLAGLGCLVAVVAGSV